MGKKPLEDDELDFSRYESFQEAFADLPNKLSGLEQYEILKVTCDNPDSVHVIRMWCTGRYKYLFFSVAGDEEPFQYVQFIMKLNPKSEGNDA